MTTHILIASGDLDTYELVVDVLEITLKRVKLDRARDYARAAEMLSAPGAGYGLVLLDHGLEKNDDRDVLPALKADFPQIANRIVLLADAANPLPDPVLLDGTPCIIKPFSLDEFAEVVQRVCST